MSKITNDGKNDNKNSLNDEVTRKGRSREYIHREQTKLARRRRATSAEEILWTSDQEDRSGVEIRLFASASQAAQQSRFAPKKLGGLLPSNEGSPRILKLGFGWLL
jgi:hypothetical protein